VVHLPVALADHVRGNLIRGCLKLMWQNMRAYQVTNNPCPYIIAELLLVSRMDYTMRILLSLLALVLSTDAVSIEMYLICKEQ
jgi:hypothetical protein